MRFSNYVQIKEANTSQEVETIFQKTTQDIDALFDQLYKGTELMVRNSEKAKLPEGLKKSIIDDLRKIAQKVQGTNPNSRLDPRAEHVTIDLCVQNIVENISAVSGVGKTGVNDSGKPIYDFKSTLTNVKNLIMDRMNQLKGAVLKSMGIIGDIHSRVNDIHGNIGNIKPQERESAEDGLVTLGGLARSNAVKLYSSVDASGKPANPIEFNPKDRQSISTVLAKINPKKVFADIGGKITPIDLTNRQSWSDLQSDIQAGVKVDPYGPIDGNKLRARKVRDAEPGGIQVNNKPRLGN